MIPYSTTSRYPNIEELTHQISGFIVCFIFICFVLSFVRNP